MLLAALRDETLVPQPEFQRRLVWSHKHKERFLETVLLGYPFPEVFIASSDVDASTGRGIEVLVDGQQRVTTLNQYFAGSPDLRLRGVQPYALLPEAEKLAFLDYEVVVRDLGRVSTEEIRQVFVRINSTSYALNSIELQHAQFDGALKQFGEAIASHDFFEEHRVFRTTEIRRMADLRFVLTLIVTIMSTYFNRDDALEEFLTRYNDEFEPADRLRDELNHVFDFVDACQLPPESRAWQKADLLTLLVESHRLVVREQARTKPESAGRNLRAFYAALVDKPAGDARTGVSTYYLATLQASNDRGSRIARGEVLRRVLMGAWAEETSSQG